MRCVVAVTRVSTITSKGGAGVPGVTRIHGGVRRAQQHAHPPALHSRHACNRSPLTFVVAPSRARPAGEAAAARLSGGALNTLRARRRPRQVGETGRTVGLPEPVELGSTRVAGLEESHCPSCRGGVWLTAQPAHMQADGTPINKKRPKSRAT
eukprot:150498-Prorocentrum_minimum.AAC.2